MTEYIIAIITAIISFIYNGLINSDTEHDIS